MIGTSRASVLCLSAVLAAGALHPMPAAALTRPKKEPETKAATCPEVGEGYVRVPGSDTCVRFGGSVRVEGATVRR